MTTLHTQAPLATSKPGSRDPRPLPTCFMAGCQKTASSWLYFCFKEHPDILVPPKDSTHFFTMHYDRGMDWYRQFFTEYNGESQVCDPTCSYVRDWRSAQRIAAFNPDAKLIFSLRNPIDRAFSHYWHEKKKNKIAFEFEEVLTNYDLYHNWVESGFYSELLQRFYDHFPAEQIKVVIYDDLKADSRAFLRSIFEFLGVDADFVPSVIDRGINGAFYKPTVKDLRRTRLLNCLAEPVRWVLPAPVKAHIRQRFLHGKYVDQVVSEYDRGMKPEVRARLREILTPENEKLSRLIGRDLSHWK